MLTGMLRKATEVSETVQENSSEGWKDLTKEKKRV